MIINRDLWKFLRLLALELRPVWKFKTLFEHIIVIFHVNIIFRFVIRHSNKYIKCKQKKKKTATYQLKYTNKNKTVDPSETISLQSLRLCAVKFFSLTFYYLQFFFFFSNNVF